MVAVHRGAVVIGILASRADEASLAIARAILDTAMNGSVDDPLADRYDLDGAELVVVDDLHIELEAVDGRFECDPAWIAVVSRHAGETGALLTAHHPGNIDAADFGGSPRRVPPACPRVLSAYLRSIEAHAPEGFDVGLECTHHGPTDVSTPILFVEVGSDREHWRDERAAEAVATALWSIRTESAHGGDALVGLGGGHYAPRFERICRETDWDVGHIAPDWALAGLEAATLEAILPALFEATETSYALLDGDRPDLAAIVESLGFQVVSERWVRATSRLSEAVVEALEAELAPVTDGLVFGEVTVSDPAALSVIDLDEALIAECVAIDRAATEAAIASATVAYALDDEGARPTGRLALADLDAVSTLVSTACSILEGKYAAVDRTDDRITAMRTTFDPEAAAAAGVPEGPLYGRLANGEPVTVEGRQVDPADVTLECTVTYELPPGV